MKMLTQNDKNHRFGRLFLALAILMIIAVPAVAAIALGAMPDFLVILRSMAPLAFFIIGGFIEVVSYAPLLGTSATYLAFITGNLVNLKVPCAVTARDNFGYENGSREGEIVSTVAVAVSTIVTTLVIALGVLALTPLTPILESPALAPAFSMSFTALFGALAYQYFSKDLRLVPIPFVVTLVLQFTLNLGYTTLIPIGALLSILSAYFFFRKGWLDKE